MKVVNTIKTALIIAVVTFSSSSIAKIYTWTDENGKVHFSDQPIADVKVDVKAVTPTTNSNISNSAKKSTQWQQDYNEAKKAKALTAQEEAKKTEKKKMLCNEIKRELATVNQGGRFYVMQPNGERDYQSDKQITDKQNKLKKLIKKNNCR